MTNEEIYKILQKSNIPVAYNVFLTPQSPPYICYYEIYSNNFFADGQVYGPISRIAIELYEEKRSAETEGNLEAMISQIGSFEKTDTYIEKEMLYKINYELEVLRLGEQSEI